MTLSERAKHAAKYLMSQGKLKPRRMESPGLWWVLGTGAKPVERQGIMYLGECWDDNKVIQTAIERGWQESETWG